MVRRFVAGKDLGTIGLAPVKRRPPAADGSGELLLEKAKEPLRLEFFSPEPLAAEKLVAARVTGRGDVVLVDGSVWEDVRTFASRLRTAGAAAGPTAPAAAEPKPEP